MFLRLLLLLTVVPFVELMILLRLAETFGWEATVSLVVLTGVLGAWLARREGLKAWARVQSDLSAGRVPAGAVVDAVLILAAGLLLVTPGVLTDLCGFALLIPPIRRRIRQHLGEAFKNRIIETRIGNYDTFIDVEGTSRDASKNDAQDDGM